MPGKRKQYSAEFREEAARMVVDSSRPIAHVAREIGVHEITLGYWVKAYREKHAGEGAPLDVSERARLHELERRNRDLEAELAFVKKAATYFAREQR
ncbi:MAG: transposase [Pseudonocardiaceae bacterium]